MRETDKFERSSMSVRLVRIAVYDHSLQAKLARNFLEAEGIPAFVGNSEIAEMNWALTNAIGGIEIRVDESQAEKARQVLDRVKDGAAQLDNEPEQFEGDSPEDASDKHLPAETESFDARDEQLERTADYAFRGAIFGLMLIPLQIYVFWLLLRIFNSEGSLSPQARTRVLIAAGINLPMMLLVIPRMLTFGWLLLTHGLD